MNGIHDLGGMHGFGTVAAEAETDEPVFHAEWERRAFALTLACGFLGRWNLDMTRYARERQHPLDYLRHSYYETWLAGLETLLAETGLVAAGELASGRARGPADPALHAPTADQAEAILRRGSPVALEADAPPRFLPGDQVRVINRHPHGHTRAPRYTRGRRGVIDRHHGAHVLPDLHVTGRRVGEHLYSVRFEAAELWGDGAGNAAVYADLWQSYLEPDR